MISLIIKDGLGNQLFQYAFTRYLQELYKEAGQNEEIAINSLFINTRDFRKTALQNFKLNDTVRYMDIEEQKKDFKVFKKRVLLANGLDVFPWKILKKKPLGEAKYLKRAQKGVYYTYRSQTEYKTKLSKAKDKYVFGCFQGEKNFAPIAETIRNEFEIIAPINLENENMLSKIQSCESVCLHIRRGDYLDARWKNLQICNFEYYNDAINEILKTVKNPVFFVFSNCHEDIEWIKENYSFRNNTTDKPINLVYVDLNNPDYEELRLMKSCKHFIISNSTFSWWAAYLSTFENKQVFVPARWNLSLEDDTSIYLNEWKKIEQFKE